MSHIEESIEVDATTVELVAPKVAAALRRGRIIGVSINEALNDSEEETFVRSIVSYAKEGTFPFDYHERTFPASDTRTAVTMATTIIKAEALNLKLQKAAGI